MSLCNYPIKTFTNLDIRSPQRFTINETTLLYFLNKYEFDKIIQHILIDFCNINVLGYDKLEDYYWC